MNKYRLLYSYIIKSIRVIIMTIGWVIFAVCVVLFILGCVFYATSVSKAFDNEENEWGDQ